MHTTEITTDHEWVRLLKNEDETALDKLWHMLFRDGVIIARKKRLDEDLGRDAAMAAYHRICTRGLAQFKFKSTFRSFCWTILTRELYRLLRKQPKTIELDTAVIGNEGLQIKPQLNAVWDRLNPCLEQLPPNRRKIFELIDLQGKRPDEVAEMMNMRRNNVNQLALRARRALKKCLQARGFLTSADVLSL